MKNSDLDSVLQAALDNRDGIEKEMTELEGVKADSTARLTALELSGDIGDAGVLGEVSRLQVLMALLPRRLTARQEALVQAEKDIIAAAHSFISKALNPHLRALTERARNSAKVSLKPHFNSDKELNSAIEASALVSELTDISSGISITSNPHFGPVRYAEQLLGFWKQAAMVESKLS